MVVTAADEEDHRPAENMTTSFPERSRSLHNFSSLPFFNVHWGRQQRLRCVKYSSSSSYDDHHRNKRKYNAVNFDDGGGLDAVREKLILEIRTEVDQMKSSIFNGRKSDEEAAPARPWNLRSRRAVCKKPAKAENDDGKHNFDKNSKDAVGPRAKFAATLTKEEIEQDFLAILGTRPARRPKKRPKYVQKQIDALCPGYWLSEITADMYKVNENAQS